MLGSINISRHFFIIISTEDMSVGFTSINGEYTTTVTSGRFSDNKQWNPVQKGDGGLRDLLCEGNTVEQILIRKQFNRAVRGFTLVFYSLNIIHIAAFIHWCRTFDHFEYWL
jgi:hypothetical protein